MPDGKECPLCGGTMRLKEIEAVDRVAEARQMTKRQVREWICPDCDYFEEAEAGEV
jgi:acetone carboxylase gamma subunit